MSDKLRKCIIAAREMVGELNGLDVWENFQTRKSRNELRAIAQKHGADYESAISCAESEIRDYMVHLGQW